MSFTIDTFKFCGSMSDCNRLLTTYGKVLSDSIGTHYLPFIQKVSNKSKTNCEYKSCKVRYWAQDTCCCYIKMMNLKFRYERWGINYESITISREITRFNDAVRYIDTSILSHKHTSLKYFGVAVRKMYCENKTPKWNTTSAQNGIDTNIDVIGGQGFYGK